MFTNDKSRSATPTNPKPNLIPSSDRRDNSPSSRPLNSGVANRDAASVYPPYGASKTGAWDMPDQSLSWDVFPKPTETTDNQVLSPPSSSRRRLELVASGSTLLPTALQSAYEVGSQLATTAAVQIVADKMEVVSIIANYAVEPSEMLHLGELNIF
jgi:hypothetical protein